MGCEGDHQVRVDDLTYDLIEKYRTDKEWTVKQTIRHLVRTHPNIKKYITDDAEV
ncbi:hypothetical protein [Sulfuricurvum sp.]|uniref:hypothetical protein n=1 Tax=Sulfuricurvum sp. TaxID=2025608 RepID=UPI00356215B7